MVVIDPWASKPSLRFFLLKLKEDGELDALIKEYVRSILGHTIVMSPSKGRYGEKGKDVVAIEDETTGEYCSYIIKRGNLYKNLGGPYGILKQMRDAVLIDLEIQQFRRKRRTATIVYNGDEGTRSAIEVFEREKNKTEEEIGADLLLRPIERWDIETITNRLFRHGEYLKASEAAKLILDMYDSYHDIAVSLVEKVEKITTTYETTDQELASILIDHVETIKIIRQTFKFAKVENRKKDV